MSITEKIIEGQQKLKLQLAVVELLKQEFLGFLWTDSPATEDDLKERMERLTPKLEKAGGLSPTLLFCLLDELEQKAIYEVSKATALAQTIRPDDLAKYLPQRLIQNAHAVRDHAYKELQSKQARSAASRPRLTRSKDRQRVEGILIQRIKSGQLNVNDNKKIVKFAEEMCEKYESLNRPQTVRGWVKEYLKQLTPSV